MDDPFFTNQDNDEIDSSLRGKYKNSWVEESFNFEKDTERQVAVKTTNNYLGCIIENKRLKIVFTCMFFGLLFLFSRIFYLQTIKGEEFRSEAEGNRIRISSIPAERGVILDSFNNELVQNIPSFTLSVIENDLPKNNKDRIEVMKRLSEVSGKSEEELRELFAKYRDFSYQSLVLKENLDYQTALELYLENVDLPGVVLESTTKRKYLNIDVLSLSHILGYVGKLNYEELQSNQAQGYIPSDIIGKIGLEKSYEEILRGIYGKKEVEVNAFGRELNTLTEDAPIPGKNIVLSLDLEAQKKLEIGRAHV